MVRIALAGLVFVAAPAAAEISGFVLDEGTGTLLVQYDSNDPNGSIAAGAFKSTEELPLTNSLRWVTHTFRLPDARFSNRTHGGDFRLSAVGAPLVVGRVSVARLTSEP